MAIAAGRLAATATTATLRLRRMMPSSSAESIDSEGLEAVAGPDGLGGRRTKEIEERLGYRNVATCDARRRVDDRGMRRLGERVDDTDVFFGQRVGAIDDAESRFAACDQNERRPYVVRAHDPLLHAAPHAERFERRLAIPTGRHAVGIGHGELFLSQRRGEGKALPDPER